MTKAQLRDIYLQWARQELDSIYLIEAVGAYLGNPEKKPTLPNTQGNSSLKAST